MKTAIIALFLCTAAVTAHAKDTYVKPYVKKDGTYVEGHYKTKADNFNLPPCTGIGGNVYAHEGTTIDLPLIRYEWQVVPLSELGPKCCSDKNRHWCEPRFLAGGACMIALYGHPKGPTGLILSNYSEAEAAELKRWTKTGAQRSDCNMQPETMRSHEICHL